MPANAANVAATGQFYGSGSQCFMSAVLKQGFVNNQPTTYAPACFRQQCTTGGDGNPTLRIQVGTVWVNCPRAGGKVAVGGGYLNKIECPAVSKRCKAEVMTGCHTGSSSRRLFGFVPNAGAGAACSGHGTCSTRGTCTCTPPYYGLDCSKIGGGGIIPATQEPTGRPTALTALTAPTAQTTRKPVGSFSKTCTSKAGQCTTSPCGCPGLVKRTLQLRGGGTCWACAAGCTLD